MPRYEELSTNQQDIIWARIRLHGKLPAGLCVYCRPVTHKGHRRMSSCRRFPHQPMSNNLCMCKEDRYCGEYVKGGR
jgi:hypothetical protein